MEIVNNLLKGLQHGFIDNLVVGNDDYYPQLVVNDKKAGEKVLSSIEKGLLHCTEFYFSVAFITDSGVISIINMLDYLKEKGVTGKIVTSQYQNFTDPKALRRLLTYNNIELRIDSTNNFHAKGYIFKHSEHYSFIVGSSNLTQQALSVNKEWNLKISSLKEGSVMQKMMNEFIQTFNNATKVTIPWIVEYEKIYSSVAKQNFHEQVIIVPNTMQEEALFNLRKLREQGKNKALIVSATGTGKTYLSVFDVASLRPKRLLFLVHRENILRAAMASFKRILGSSFNMGIYTGNEKNDDADYIFATIQTMSKESHMHLFSSTYFEYIVIDDAVILGLN